MVSKIWTRNFQNKKLIVLSSQSIPNINPSTKRHFFVKSYDFGANEFSFYLHMFDNKKTLFWDVFLGRV